VDEPRDPAPPTPDELLRMVLGASDGRTPAGTLALIQMLAAQLAEQTGAALSPGVDQHRPEDRGERSSKIVAAECLAQPAIDQTEAANPVRVAEREQQISSGQTAGLIASHAGAIDKLRALLAEMAAAGFAVNFALQPAATVVRAVE
jgi:hypothetical protein